MQLQFWQSGGGERRGKGIFKSSTWHLFPNLKFFVVGFHERSFAQYLAKNVKALWGNSALSPLFAASLLKSCVLCVFFGSFSLLWELGATSCISSLMQDWRLNRMHFFKLLSWKWNTQKLPGTDDSRKYIPGNKGNVGGKRTIVLR